MNTDCRKPLSLLFLVLILMITAAAQDTQRFETFAGYSFTHDSSFVEPGTNYSGWDTSTTVFLKRWLGITSDFSGHYGGQTNPIFCTAGGCFFGHTSVNSYTYLFGPHFKYQRSRYSPFVQTLFGVHHPDETFRVVNTPSCNQSCGTFSVLTNAPYTKFAMALGGGLDIAIGHGFSIRPVQAEYLLQREPSLDRNLLPITVNNNVFRYSTGITFHFGQKLGQSK